MNDNRKKVDNLNFPFNVVGRVIAYARENLNINNTTNSNFK